MSTTDEIEARLTELLKPHVEEDRVETMKLAIAASRLLVEPSVDIKAHNIVASRDGRLLQVAIETTLVSGRIVQRRLQVHVDGLDWEDAMRPDDGDDE